MLLKAIDKIFHILDAQSVCQLKSLLAVSFGFWKARMFGLSSLVFIGFDGLVLFLVVMGFGRSYAVFVALNLGETTIVGRNLDESKQVQGQVYHPVLPIISSEVTFS
jgi:hypothetical protein